MLLDRARASLGSDSRWTRVMIVGVVLLAVLFAAGTATVLAVARREAYQRAATATENVAATLSDDLDQIIRLYDRSILATVAALGTPGIFDVPLAIRQFALFDESLGEHYFGGLVIADAQGRVIAQKRGGRIVEHPIAEEPAFIAQRDSPDVGLVVIPSYRDGRVGETDLVISRRIPARDGSFGGAVIGRLSTSFFREAAERLDLGERGLLALSSLDGRLLARVPPMPGAVGATVRNPDGPEATAAKTQGVIERTTPLDGMRRLFAYRRVGGLPLVVAAATDTLSIYSVWWRQVAVTGGATLIMSGALIALACLLARELGHRRTAALEASEAAERFRMIVDTATDIILRLGLDGTRRYISPSVFDLLGYRPEELVGLNWTMVAHAQDVAVMEEALAQLRAGLDQSTVKYRAIRKDGEAIWLEARIRPMRNAVTGRAEELIAIARDVTWQQRLEEELASLAATDGLTGAANRRCFDERLEAEWSRAARIGDKVSLLLMDADKFKDFNDTYGHLEGDRVLQSIVASASEVIRRPTDLAARYGGEEFAILLPGVDLEGALHVAELVRRGVEARAIPHERGPAGIVTVSIGVACLTVRSLLGRDVLIETADRALYAAKHSGRNRVAHAEPGHDAPTGASCFSDGANTGPARGAPGVAEPDGTGAAQAARMTGPLPCNAAEQAEAAAFSPALTRHAMVDMAAD